MSFFRCLGYAYKLIKSLSLAYLEKTLDKKRKLYRILQFFKTPKCAVKSQIISHNHTSPVFRRNFTVLTSDRLWSPIIIYSLNISALFSWSVFHVIITFIVGIENLGCVYMCENLVTLDVSYNKISDLLPLYK